MITQISGDQEVLSHSIVTGPTHGVSLIGVAKELQRTASRFLHRGHEEPVAPILDLETDATDVPTDNRNTLPEGLAHNQPEPLTEGFRQCDVGFPLKHVHLDRADATEVGQKVYIGIIAGVPRSPLEP